MGLWGFGKKVINSTIGTASFKSLDNIIHSDTSSIQSSISNSISILSIISSRTSTLLGGVQVFTSSGSFTVPGNVNKIWITACAGGQGGWGYSSNKKGGQGGEWIVRKPYSVYGGQSLSITIGTGGVFNYSDSQSNQKPGGNTVIGSLVTLLGGGISGNVLGGSGAYDQYSSRDGYASGGGGDGGGGGSLGRGGCSQTKIYQAGYGGGGYGSSSSNFGSSGDGGNGIVIIEW